MPLFKISIQGEGNERTYNLEPKLPTTYSAENLKERKDLQALLLNRPDAIDKDLLILREEFSGWQDSKRRIDLLAIDKQANLVVIELKTEEEGGHMELQAVRYAAMVSTMDFEGVVRERERLLTKQRKDPNTARAEVLQHLNGAETEEPTIGNMPRIILVSPSFSIEITTTVLWLNSAGLDIRCLEAKPYNLDNTPYLLVEQILPLPAAADFMVKAAKKEREADEVRYGKSKDTIHVLLDNDVLHPGQRLRFLGDSISGFQITNEVDKGAEFLGSGSWRNEVRWDGDDGAKIYTLSGLCNVLYEKYSGKPPGTGYNGTYYWGREGSDLSLWQERLNLLSSQLPDGGTP